MMMNRKNILWLSLLSFVLLLASCQKDAPPPTATPVAVETGDSTGGEADSSENDSAETSTPLSPAIYFSEVLPGISGDNTHEFIELHNTGHSSVDLSGWSIGYQLKEGKDESVIYVWEGGATEIPPLGHYLLAYDGTDLAVTSDAVYETALFERKGGLVLRDGTGEIVDSIGWGEAPAGYFAGEPAAAPEGGSLERLPGGEAGNGQNEGSNAADFQLLATPNPQNSGSAVTPLPAHRLALTLTAPDNIEPGQAFDVTATLQNLTGETAVQIDVTMALSPEFEMVTLPDGVVLVENEAQWTISSLADGLTDAKTFALQAPLTYTDMKL